MRRFCGLSLVEAIPDESAILHFRHLLERHDLGTELFETINAHLAKQGLRLREGTHFCCTPSPCGSHVRNPGRPL